MKNDSTPKEICKVCAHLPTLLLFLLSLSFGCKGQDQPNRTQEYTPFPALSPKGLMRGFHLGHQNVNNNYVYYSDGQQFTDSMALKTLYYDKSPYIPKGISEHNNYESYDFMLFSLEDLTLAQKKQAFGDMFAGNRAFQDSLKTAAFCTQMATPFPVHNGFIVCYRFVLYSGSLRGDYGKEQLSVTTYQWYNSKFEKGKSLDLPHSTTKHTITKDKKYALIETCISRFGDGESSLPKDAWLIDLEHAKLLGKVPVSSDAHGYFEFKYDDKKNIYYAYVSILDKPTGDIRNFELIVFDPVDATFYTKELSVDSINSMHDEKTYGLPVPEWN